MSELSSVCLLTGSPYISSWYAKALEKMAQDADVDVPLVVVKAETARDGRVSPDNDSEAPRGLKEHILEWGSSLFGTGIEPFHYINISEVNCLTSATVRECDPIRDGIRFKIPSSIVTEVTNRTDVVVHTGFGILSGEILSEPRHGVLSFHHGDIRQYRGGPPAFWEFLYGEDEVGITLQHLTETLDGGRVVVSKSVDVRNEPTLPAVRKRLYDESVPMLTTAVRRLRDPQFEPTVVDEEKLGEIYATSDQTRKVKFFYALRTLYNVVRN